MMVVVVVVVLLQLATSFWSPSLLFLHFKHASIEPSAVATTACPLNVLIIRIDRSPKQPPPLYAFR